MYIIYTMGRGQGKKDNANRGIILSGLIHKFYPKVFMN